ncbi:MAG: hypothetical protein ABI304_02690 [Rudaea sp.]
MIPVAKFLRSTRRTDFSATKTGIFGSKNRSSSNTRICHLNRLIARNKKKLLTLALAWRTFSFAANHNILCLLLMQLPKYLGSAVRTGVGQNRPQAGDKHHADDLIVQRQPSKTPDKR